MKYKREPGTWKSSVDIDSESETNDNEPLLSDVSAASRRSFGATCMFPDASETSDFESSRNVPPTGVQNGSTRVNPFFLRPNIESTVEDGLSRFKYYSKIKNFIRREDTNPRISDHMVPSSVFVPFIMRSEQHSGKQGSIVTIFSVWNTIIGSSLLTMPWSMEKAGLANGVVLVVIMGALCLYTAYLLLRVQQLHGHADWEVPDLAGFLLGIRSEMIAKFSSIVVLMGANIVYWILMSNFLYHSVDYLYDKVNGFSSSSFNGTTSVICLKNITLVQAPETDLDFNLKATPQDYVSLYDQIWNLHTTVPIFLVFIIGPLVNFKSATFFTKFNSLGTLSVLYLLAFVLIKSSSWGVNVNFTDPFDPLYVSNFNGSFPALTGMLALALFIHNIIITIMRNNKHQEKNRRDLSIAFSLVILTYLGVGVTFYVGFPLDKQCIEANLLDNFESSDTMTVIARVFLFFQLVTVYPLITYMLRVQLFTTLLKKIYPGIQHVLLLNTIMILTCVLFAIFLPRIGTIVRFTGALSGFIYIFTLPSLLQIASLKKRGQLTIFSTIFHIFIIIIGFANIIAQFFITEH